MIRNEETATVVLGIFFGGLAGLGAGFTLLLWLENATVWHWLLSGVGGAVVGGVMAHWFGDEIVEWLQEHLWWFW